MRRKDYGVRRRHKQKERSFTNIPLFANKQNVNSVKDVLGALVNSPEKVYI